MIRPDDVIRITLSGPTYDAVLEAAESSTLGGRSRVRQGNDQAAHCRTDQLVGRAGEAALAIWLTGSDRAFRLTRRAADRAPYVGDGGSDLIELDLLDVKASLDRYPDRDLLDYHLVVRPEERHEGALYVLGIVTLDEQGEEAEVFLLGWLREADLPEEPDGRGTFEGAYTVKGRDLNPLPPLRWI